LHDLRHSFASFLVNRGVSLYVVQGLLGHGHTRYTQRYAHLAPDTLREAAETVGSVIADARSFVGGRVASENPPSGLPTVTMETSLSP
jgi:hypothetical protein